MFFDYNIS